MKNFKLLLIWQKGDKIAVQSFKLVETFHEEEKFSLTNQITTASGSIPSNIAAGSSRTSEKDYNRFMEISPGVSFELETGLFIAEAVKYRDSIIRTNMLQNVVEEQKMVVSFMSKLNK